MAKYHGRMGTEKAPGGLGELSEGPSRRERRSEGKRARQREVTRRAYQVLELGDRGLSPAAISTSTQVPEELVVDLLELLRKRREAEPEGGGA